MKPVVLLKTTCTIILFLATTVVFAQDSIRLFEPLPSNSEKYNLKLPKAYWGTKYKVTVENYGVAKMKEGITSTSSNRKKGVNYSETKQKLFISLTDTNNISSNLQVQTEQKEEYVIKNNFLENTLLNVTGTGVETSEIQNWSVFPKTISGTITTNLENSKNWDINLIKDNEPSLFTKMGSLTNGERTINVILTNLDSNKNINENGDIYVGASFCEFVENGISLGAVGLYGEHSIWLKPGLDPSTKLILITALLLAGGY